MRNAPRTIATAVASLVVAVGVVTITAIPAQANTDSSWGYVKTPTSGN